MFKNQKYEQWKNSQCDRKDIETYIGLEISPEDIEIFSNILFPEIIEYKNYIVHIPSESNEQEIRDIEKLINQWMQSSKEQENIEKNLNFTLISDIFLNTCSQSSLSTLNNIAILIKSNWEKHLEHKFPDKKFIVEIISKDEEPAVTFYQIKPA